MNHDDFDNENIAGDHVDNETTAEGRKVMKRRFRRTVDDAVIANNLAVLEPIQDDDQQQRSGQELPRLVSDDLARQQRTHALANANFDYSLLNEKKPKKQRLVAANDNGFKETESWPLMEQLNRTSFQPDATKRAEYIGTVRYIRGLVDEADQDALGLAVHRPGKEATPDHDLDRSQSGNVIYAFGQTLDRSGRTYDHRDGVANERRFDGPVRTAKKSVPVSNGFNGAHDDPVSQRRIDAKIELDDLAAIVGPLWLPLLKAICENAGFTAIAKALGYDQPVVGSAFIKLALEVATTHLKKIRGAKDFRQYLNDNPRVPVAPRRYRQALNLPIAA